MSTFGNARIISCEVSLPPAGAWHAVAKLDSTALPAAVPTQLQIGDLTLIGTPIRSSFDDDLYGALVSVVIRGGAGGWGHPVSNRGRYQADGSFATGGVRLLTVLRDLGAMAGEDYVAPSDVSLGTRYQWEAHQAHRPVRCQDVLADLVWAGAVPTWRVHVDGKTRFDAWPSLGAADGRGRILARDGERRRRTVGLDVFVSAWLPGATVENTPITRTVIRETPDALIAMVR